MGATPVKVISWARSSRRAHSEGTVVCSAWGLRGQWEQDARADVGRVKKWLRVGGGGDLRTQR